MPRIPEIKGSCFVLREINPEKDKEAYWQNINDPDIVNQMTTDYPYDEKQWNSFLKYYEQIKKDEVADLCWVIDIDGECVGDIGLRIENNCRRHVGNLGYWLAKKHWGKGIMSEAVGLVCDYGFKELGLLKLKIDFLSDNIGSRRVAEKNGFKVECTMAKESFKEGKYKDITYACKFRDE